MIKIPVQDGDDAAFISQVETTARKIASDYPAGGRRLVKINNWFGPNWLRFSGKMLGAVGVWKEKLTVPPFVPNRVVSDSCFVPPKFSPVAELEPLHVVTPGSKAVLRRVSDVTPDMILIWFNGQTQSSNRGCIMSYIPVSDGYWTWYSGWSRNGSWSVSRLRGISANELAILTRE
jgi:hypothetical protein